MEWVNQVILNMLAAKYLSNKVFDCIYLYSETLAYIAWEINSSYNRTIQATPFQARFGRKMILKPTSVIYGQVITAGKHWQVNIDNIQGKSRLVTHDYKIGDLVYVVMTGIYQKLDYKKQGPYIIP